MRVTLEAPSLLGAFSAIPSKSEVHRALILMALSDRESRLICHGSSEDIEATAASLRALGARVLREGDLFTVTPIAENMADVPAEAPVLPVGESGSTLRFLIPVALALYPTGAVFEMRGRLPQRPLSPLRELLESKGVSFTQLSENRLLVKGSLPSGEYSLPGDVSSQFVSGLLFALPLLSGDSHLVLTGKIESAPYISMTLDAIHAFRGAVRDVSGYFTSEKSSVKAVFAENTAISFSVKGREKGRPAYSVREDAAPRRVGGDYSNAAFLLVAGAVGKHPITVTGLLPDTRQGDRRILDELRIFGACVREEDDCVTVYPSPLTGGVIDASQIPDLVPILAVAAAAAEGETRFANAGRLRLKESDRIQSTCDMLRAVGGAASETEDGLIVIGGRKLSGGVINAAGDHRIAMAGAVLSTLCEGTVTIVGAEAVKKSYPAFFQDFESHILGGRLTVSD